MRINVTHTHKGTVYGDVTMPDKTQLTFRMSASGEQIKLYVHCDHAINYTGNTPFIKQEIRRWIAANHKP